MIPAFAKPPADVFTKPSDVDPDTLANLGPPRPLAGRWRARKGVDLNPKADGPERRVFIETTPFAHRAGDARSNPLAAILARRRATDG